jgi:hypothetical protein
MCPLWRIHRVRDSPPNLVSVGGISEEDGKGITANTECLDIA